MNPKVLDDSIGEVPAMERGNRQLDSNPSQTSWPWGSLSVFHLMFGTTKLWSVAGQPCGQRWVTTFVRVKKRMLSSPY